MTEITTGQFAQDQCSPYEGLDRLASKEHFSSLQIKLPTITERLQERLAKLQQEESEAKELLDLLTAHPEIERAFTLISRRGGLI